jgi:hypothetical protein
VIADSTECIEILLGYHIGRVAGVVLFLGDASAIEDWWRFHDVGALPSLWITIGNDEGWIMTIASILECMVS